MFSISTGHNGSLSALSFMGFTVLTFLVSPCPQVLISGPHSHLSCGIYCPRLSVFHLSPRVINGSDSHLSHRAYLAHLCIFPCPQLSTDPTLSLSHTAYLAHPYIFTVSTAVNGPFSPPCPPIGFTLLTCVFSPCLQLSTGPTVP